MPAVRGKQLIIGPHDSDLLNCAPPTDVEERRCCNRASRLQKSAGGCASRSLGTVRQTAFFTLQHLDVPHFKELSDDSQITPGVVPEGTQVRLPNNGKARRWMSRRDEVQVINKSEWQKIRYFAGVLRLRGGEKRDQSVGESELADYTE
ncbi:unnamed protein product [Pleuronectes platessa]|uniref:Uncharacterized protein n=1 Tax=Pleuronectes platessa TaxID=8262 RepID=A0A9N7ZBG2_PLEPL|nr:unnamed protein product [Pleuronectes platessa]